MNVLTQILRWLYQIAGGELAIFMVLILVAACVPAQADENESAHLEEARQALSAYLTALHSEDYATAANYYGGSTDFLQESNPKLDPQNTAQLLSNGCRVNGLQCLPMRSISTGLVLDQNVYSFDVQFSTPEGELFARGPCCGATEIEMPTQFIFSFKVLEQDGRYVVLDLPPYVP
jgi:hypothetical protein